jgi:hypothetical protein
VSRRTVRAATAHDLARVLAGELGPAWSAEETRCGTAVVEGPDGMVRVWVPEAGMVRVDVIGPPEHLVWPGQGEFTGAVIGTPEDLPALAAVVVAELAPVMAARTEVLTARTERALADLVVVTDRVLDLLGPRARAGSGRRPGHVKIGWPGGWVELHTDGTGPVYATNLRMDTVRSHRGLLALLLAADVAPVGAGA